MPHLTWDTPGFSGTGSPGTGSGGARVRGTGAGGTRKSAWGRFFGGCGRCFVGLLPLGAGVAVGLIAGRQRLWAFYDSGADARAFFILLVAAGLFPFSAIAYR